MHSYQSLGRPQPKIILAEESFAVNISALLLHSAVKSLNQGQGITGRTGCAETLAEPTHIAAALRLEDPPSFLHLLNLSHIIIHPLQSQVPKTVPILFLFKLVMFFCPAHTHMHAHTHTHKMVPAVVNYSAENIFLKKEKVNGRSAQNPQSEGVNVSH